MIFKDKVVLYRFFYLFVPLFLIAFSKFLFCDVAVSMTSNKKLIYMDEKIILTIIVASEGEKLSFPDISEFKGFSFRKISNTSHFSMINGVMTYNKKIIYRLSPEGPGLFKFPSVIVKAKGKKYFSNSLSVIVKSGFNPDPISSVSGLTKPRIFQNAKGIVQDNKASVAFVSAKVDKKECFVNEQVLLSVIFHSRVPVVGDLLYDQPSLDQFGKESVYPHKVFYVDRDNFRYRSTKIRTILFPVKAGISEIGSAKIECYLSDHDRREKSFLDIDSFFDNLTMFNNCQKALLRTKPIKIKVNPLPKEGQPQNFSGAVGVFAIKVSSDKKEIFLGEVLNVRVSIGGQGMIKGTTLPKFLDFKGVQVFPSKASYKKKQRLNLDVFTRCDQEIALVPEKEGILKIPSLKWSYFDPKKKKYIVTQTEPFTIKVKPSKKKIKKDKMMDFAEHSLPKKDAMEKKEAIRYFKETFSRNKKAVSWFSFQRFFLFLLVFPLFFFLCMLSFDKSKDFLADNFLKKRKQRKLKKFLKSLEKLVAHGKKKDFYTQVNIFLREYISFYDPRIKKNSTTMDIERMLREIHGDFDLIEKIRIFMDQFDQIRFSGVMTSSITLEQHFKELDSLLAQIEKDFLK